MNETDAQRAWLAELDRMVADQPSTSWTIARLQITYPSPEPRQRTIVTDTLAAAGRCNAQVEATGVNRDFGRIEARAMFSDFEMRGNSPYLGPFEITLQEGRKAEGLFRQRYGDSLFPLSGEWRVPFQVQTRLGLLIPRPSDPEVALRSAEPGEFAIPPIGSWFQKWDPIALVSIDMPDGPTIATIDHAMHCMLNSGDGPDIPPFYRR